MRPENLKEIEKFCNDVKSRKPNITNDELKILLAEFMKKKQISVAEVIEQVKTTQKKACSVCGAENEADVVFCIACGQALESEEKSKLLDAAAKVQENDLEVHTSDNQPNEAEVASEAESGSVICKQCGAVLDLEATFCTSCGAQTGDAEIQPKKYPFAGVICSYCEKRIEIRQEVTVCPKCGEPHHAECWVANNYSCSLPDCDGREITSDETAANLNQDNVAAGSKEAIPNGDSGKAEPGKGEETRGTRGTPFLDKLRAISGKRGELGKHKIKVGIVAAIILILLPIWYVFSSPYDIGTTSNEFRDRYNSAIHNERGLLPPVGLDEYKGFKIFTYGSKFTNIVSIVNKDGKIRLVMSGGDGKIEGYLSAVMVATVRACSPELSESDAKKLLVNLTPTPNAQNSKATVVGNLRYNLVQGEGKTYLFISHKKENKEDVLADTIHDKINGSKK